MNAIGKTVTAYAPASVGNVGVGFDALGHALDFAGDRVRLTVIEGKDILLDAVTGLTLDLPSDAGSNTALRALRAIQDEYNIRVGARVTLEKGIPLGSGMGGSAASAVAAVTAAAEAWGLSLSEDDKLRFALEGEAAASGGLHADNVAPSLFGGLVLCEGVERPHVTRIPVPRNIACVLVHPDLEVYTRSARNMLSAGVSLADHVCQTQAIAGFVAGCFRSDLDQIRRCLKDVVIEPQRAELVPGFRKVQSAAMANGALGASLSGSGPSIFAWCESSQAEEIRGCMTHAFQADGVSCSSWISAVNAAGARLED